MKEPLKKGELDVRVNYIKLGQAIKTAIYTLQKVEIILAQAGVKFVQSIKDAIYTLRKLEIILEQAGLEAGLKELERMERDEKFIVD
jgi:formylmethanofuran dehydrogenase subunit A